MATILYIEDNEAVRQLVQLIFQRREDLELLEAETGTQGLSLAFSARPDLIMIDISLPDMDGGEVLKILRENTNTAAIPVIAISGDPAVNTRLAYPGFQDYLEKPIDIPALYRAIDALIL